MKRKDLMAELAEWAKAQGLQMVVTEGGNHTKVKIGDRQTVIPRHSEINEITAKQILRQIGARR